LFAELFAASPQAMPRVPSVRTDASAIFFIIPIDLLSSSKSPNCCGQQILYCSNR
jgi:hypothetical protein